MKRQKVKNYQKKMREGGQKGERLKSAEGTQRKREREKEMKQIMNGIEGEREKEKFINDKKKMTMNQLKREGKHEDLK